MDTRPFFCGEGCGLGTRLILPICPSIHRPICLSVCSSVFLSIAYHNIMLFAPRCYTPRATGVYIIMLPTFYWHHTYIYNHANRVNANMASHVLCIMTLVLIFKGWSLMPTRPLRVCVPQHTSSSCCNCSVNSRACVYQALLSPPQEPGNEVEILTSVLVSKVSNF